VQIDPIKPTLKAPGPRRLKLKYYELLSSFAFNVNLRRFSWEEGGLRVRVLFYVRLREGAAADFPGNARPAPVTAWPHTAFPFQLNLTVYTGIP